MRRSHAARSPSVARHVDTDQIARIVRLETRTDTMSRTLATKADVAVLPTLATKADVAPLTGLPAKVDSLQTDMAAVKTDMAAMRADMGGFKRDLATLESNLKADLVTLESRLKADSSALESRLKAESAALERNLKAESAALERNLKAESATLENKVKIDIASLESRLIRWMAGVAIATVTVIISTMNFQLARFEARYLRPGAAPVGVAPLGDLPRAHHLPANPLR